MFEMTQPFERSGRLPPAVAVLAAGRAVVFKRRMMLRERIGKQGVTRRAEISISGASRRCESSVEGN